MHDGVSDRNEAARVLNRDGGGSWRRRRGRHTAETGGRHTCATSCATLTAKTRDEEGTRAHLARSVGRNAHRFRNGLLVFRQKPLQLVETVGKAGEVGAHGHYAVRQRFHQHEWVRLRNAGREDGDVAAREDELEQRVRQAAKEVHALREPIHAPVPNRGRRVEDRRGVDWVELRRARLGQRGELLPRPAFFVAREAPAVGDEPIV